MHYPPDSQSERERRASPRIPWSVGLSAVVSSTIPITESALLGLKGVAFDYSHGGIGMVGDRLLPPGVVVRCEVHLQESQFRIPTVLRVCWSEESLVNGRYRIGLKFLL